MFVNSTNRFEFNEIYSNIDRFPSSSYEDEQIDSSAIPLNQSYYDQFVHQSTTTTVSLISSTPMNSIIIILVFYLILTIVLLSFSLYKQRQTEMENFYFGDTDEDIQQGKRYLVWKQFLIGKIRKGDIEPLISNRTDQHFPLETEIICDLNESIDEKNARGKSSKTHFVSSTSRTNLTDFSLRKQYR